MRSPGAEFTIYAEVRLPCGRFTTWTANDIVAPVFRTEIMASAGMITEFFVLRSGARIPGWLLGD